MAMSNLLCFIIGALALAAADYVFSFSAALINRIPLLPTLPMAYIYISSPLFVCAYKLINAFQMDLFFSAFAEDISSRIISWLIDHFPSFQSNQGHKNRDQMNSGQMNDGMLNNSKGSRRQINGDQVNTGHSSGGQMNGDQNSGGQMNGVQMNGGEMKNDKLNSRQRSRIFPSSGGQMNAVQMNKGVMNNGEFNIEQS